MSFCKAQVSQRCVYNELTLQLLLLAGLHISYLVDVAFSIMLSVFRNYHSDGHLLAISASQALHAIV